ncbi:MAG: hypothetical protein QOD29_1536 [Alphaproteobacteria bacterium]|nr:hypothetical protein [Alphaproteobacteria bacterium]
MLATQELISQPADGYTLSICTYFDPVNTLLYRKARYKVSDIAPVSLIGTMTTFWRLQTAFPPTHCRNSSRSARRTRINSITATSA